MERLKMKIRFHSEERPGVLLWLVGKFVIVTVPQAVLVTTIMTHLGAKADIITFACAAALSFIVTGWLGSLELEVADYIKKKYPEL
jgi:hypothetical protein